MVDEDGNFGLLAAAVLGFLLFTDPGYEIQKFISPVAVKFNVHLSSEQTGLGMDVSAGIPKMYGLSYRAHAGGTYYWNHFDDSYSGWEFRLGGEYSYGWLVSYSGTTFYSGGTSQTTNMVKIGGPFINFKYENDYFWNISLPGVPKADNGDRYRTAAWQLNLWPFNTGGYLFTGDPGDPNEVPYDERNTKEIDGHRTYVKHRLGYDPDKYRAGICYFGMGPLRVGVNSEGIRNRIQNKTVHKRTNSPYFRVDETRDAELYWGLSTGTGNTLW